MTRGNRPGFSLVELLVVTGLLGIFLGLVLPAAQRARGAAARISCLNNLKQIGVALHVFHDAYGRFPPLPVSSPNGGDPNDCVGWMALILPQMGEEPLYKTTSKACEMDPDPLHNPPHIGMATVIKSYVCPADGRLLTPLTDQFQVTASYTSYIGIGGAVPRGATKGFSGALGGAPGCRLSDITDGASQTIMVGERPPPDSLQAGW
jgi:prepilin-type N-terminal cleavage/methylation domain-containing protein